MISIKKAKQILANKVKKYRVTSIKSIGSGREWNVFLIICDLRYKNISPPLYLTGGHEFIVRIKRGPINIDQNQIMIGLSRMGMTERISNNDYSICLCKYIEGETVEDRYSGNPLRHESTKFNYLPSFVITLRMIHQNHLTICFVGDSWISSLKDKLKSSFEYLRNHNIEIDITYTHLLFHLYNLEPNPSVLLHGDLSPRNIILKPDSIEVSGLIDWDTAQYGDYMYDLSNWATFNDHAMDQFPNLLRLYHGLEPDKVIHPLLWKRFWVYFTLISIFKIVNLHKLGYENLDRAHKRIEMGIKNISDN